MSPHIIITCPIEPTMNPQYPKRPVVNIKKMMNSNIALENEEYQVNESEDGTAEITYEWMIDKDT